MRLLTAILASLAATTTQARITGIAVPSTIKPGDEITAEVIGENYIQRVYEVAIAFGYVSGDGYPGTLGTVADTFYLGPDESNLASNVTKTFTVPDSVPAGEGLITASLFSLYGASTSPVLTGFNVSVTFGDETSTTYKGNN